jgi:hypothetical protein
VSEQPTAVEEPRNNPVTPPEEPQADPETPEGSQPEPEGPTREAAKYRRRLRETEAERDALRERVENYERRDAEGIARDLGAAVPADLWTLVGLDDLRGDSGELDEELVRQRVGAILTERPTWRRPAPDLGQGPRQPSHEPRTPGLSDLLGKR